MSFDRAKYVEIFGVSAGRIFEEYAPRLIAANGLRCELLLSDNDYYINKEQKFEKETEKKE
jgi:hypothetical protein